MSTQPPTTNVQESPRVTSWHDWAQFCRLPNIFTAVADPLAGALLAGVGWRDSGQVVIVMLASACLYAGGVMLNDLHDYRRDCVARPQRPLPSGRISRWRALFAAAVVLSTGELLASTLSTATAGLAFLLLACILAYDVLIKELPVAPVAMGAARAINLLMGMTLVEAPPGLPRAYLASALGLYVIGTTVFARREDGTARTDQLLLGAGFTAVSLLMLALLGLFFRDQVTSAAGTIWLVTLAVIVGYSMTQAILTPAPARIKRAVKAAVLGIILFDAGVVAFRFGLPLSLAVVGLLIPAVWLGRRTEVT